MLGFHDFEKAGQIQKGIHKRDWESSIHGCYSEPVELYC